jgi:hypothetical protein
MAAPSPDLQVFVSAKRQALALASLLVLLCGCDPHRNPLEPQPPRPGDPVEPRTPLPSGEQPTAHALNG